MSAPPPGILFTFQVAATSELPSPATVATRSMPSLTETDAEAFSQVSAAAHDIVTVGMGTDVMVSDSFPTTFGSATEAALMTTVAGLGTWAGAVYTPACVIVPTVLLPPVT